MKPKQYFYGLIAILVLITAGGGYGYYYSTQKLDKRTQELRQKLAELQIADSEITKLNTLKSQFLAVEPFLPLLDDALPRSKDQSKIILQLEQLAQAAGLTLPQASFQSTGGLPGPTTQTAKAGEVFAMPITFQMTGSYQQMQTFLQGLEKLGRYTSVSSISITSSGPRVVNFSVTLQVFMKP
jgi:Tfp pilus assembly protein PilO